MNNTELKQRAIELRQQGCTYPEILSEVKVAKSTLWSWLKGVYISPKIQHYFQEQKVIRANRAASVWHSYKAMRKKEIYRLSSQEIGILTKREMWLMGVVLYWAEGSKEKENQSGVVKFTNSDPNMIIIFHNWLITMCDVNRGDIIYEFYIHETRKDELPEMLDYWARILNCDSNILRVYYKTHKPKTSRTNVGDNYRGLIRIVVRKSTKLLRKIDGWIQGIGSEIT